MPRRKLPISVQKAIERQLARAPGANLNTGGKPKLSKHRNIERVVTDQQAMDHPGQLVAGERFDSGLEMNICMALRKRYGLRAVVRQVSIPLPGGVRMVPDFMVYRHDRPALFADAKGRATQEWKNKQKSIDAAYGIHVHELNKPGDVWKLPD
jgi:hypothetical protein